MLYALYIKRLLWYAKNQDDISVNADLIFVQTGRLCNTFYRAHGNMIDWMYAKNHVKYSFVAHLRDTGTYGFALPPNLIRPVGEETAGMLSYLARFVAKRDG